MSAAKVIDLRDRVEIMLDTLGLGGDGQPSELWAGGMPDQSATGARYEPDLVRAERQMRAEAAEPLLGGTNRAAPQQASRIDRSTSLPKMLFPENEGRTLDYRRQGIEIPAELEVQDRPKEPELARLYRESRERAAPQDVSRGRAAQQTNEQKQAVDNMLRCLGPATFSAVGPYPRQAPGYSAFDPKKRPANGTVAIAGRKTFGFDNKALREGAAAAIKIYPQGLDDVLEETGGPTPPYTVGDFGDKHIRNAKGVQYDIYRFPTMRDGRKFGTHTVQTITEVPPGGHCPPGSVPIKRK